jgi:hypothetical protein
MSRSFFVRESFIPAGAVKVSDKASSAVVYIRADKQGRACAVGFQGKAIKPSFNCWYGSEKRREQHVREFFEKVARSETYKAERAAEKKAKLARPHKLQLGHIMVATWGYDQTNVDFYQVTGLRGARTVELRKIARISEETASMQGNCTPRADAFTGEAFTRRIDEDNAVKLSSYCYARLWDGRVKAWTAYA